MPSPDIVPDKLWKVTIAPTGQDDPEVTPTDSLVFCREHAPQIIGAGWSIHGAGSDKAEALRLIKKQRGKVPTEVKILLNKMEIGHHAWVYDRTDGSYYVCKIDSDWQYAEGGDWDRHDIHNYRRARWRQVPKPLVLGAITRRITLQGTANEMHVDEVIREYSAFVFEVEPSVSDLREELDLDELRTRLQTWETGNLFAAFDEDETEDVVGLYLQQRGWRMLKSSAYRSHPMVECQFQKVIEGAPRTAYMQVKSGKHIRLDAGEYKQLVNEGARVFLFSTAQRPYRGEDSVKGVETLSQDAIRSFAIANLELLPYPMTLKLGLMSGVIGLPS